MTWIPHYSKTVEFSNETQQKFPEKKQKQIKTSVKQRISKRNLPLPSRAHSWVKTWPFVSFCFALCFVVITFCWCCWLLFLRCSHVHPSSLFAGRSFSCCTFESKRIKGGKGMRKMKIEYMEARGARNGAGGWGWGEHLKRKRFHGKRNPTHKILNFHGVLCENMTYSSEIWNWPKSNWNGGRRGRGVRMREWEIEQ